MRNCLFLLISVRANIRQWADPFELCIVFVKAFPRRKFVDSIVRHPQSSPHKSHPYRFHLCRITDSFVYPKPRSYIVLDRNGKRKGGVISSSTYRQPPRRSASEKSVNSSLVPLPTRLDPSNSYGSTHVVLVGHFCGCSSQGRFSNGTRKAKEYRLSCRVDERSSGVSCASTLRSGGGLPPRLSD